MNKNVSSVKNLMPNTIEKEMLDSFQMINSVFYTHLDITI